MTAILFGLLIAAAPNWTLTDPPGLMTGQSLSSVLTVKDHAATLRFETPGAGSYSVLTSPDLLRWTITACGHVRTATHVSAQLPANGWAAFYAVNFNGAL